MSSPYPQFDTLCRFLLENELDQDRESRTVRNLSAISVRRLLALIRTTRAGHPFVWSLYDGQRWVPDSDWLTAEAIDKAVSGAGPPWSWLRDEGFAVPWHDLPSIDPAPALLPPIDTEQLLRVSPDPGDVAAARWMDLIGQLIVEHWVDPAVDDAHRLIETSEPTNTPDDERRTTAKVYATGFIQTNVFGLLQYICDTEGDADFGAEGYLGLNVVAHNELLVTPVDASWNFPGELIDSHNGWIQRFSRHPYVSPTVRPSVDFP